MEDRRREAQTRTRCEATFVPEPEAASNPVFLTENVEAWIKAAERGDLGREVVIAIVSFEAEQEADQTPPLRNLYESVEQGPERPAEEQVPIPSSWLSSSAAEGAGCKR